MSWPAALIALLGLIGQNSCGADTPSDQVDRRVDELLGRMTLEEKLEYVGGVHAMSIRPVPRLGLPEIRMSDGPVGIRQDRPSTRYPAGIALAATWNPQLGEKEGAAMGRDCRARGIHILLAPGLNINRVPVCGRNFEYLGGEDPYLASQMVVPFVRGVQGQGVVATVKHFAANNQEFNRMQIDAVIDERTLREIYLPAFEAAVKTAKVGAVMDAYNRVNGLFCTENRFLNLKVLKSDWNFPGVLMSDWGATHSTLAALTGGLDLEMPSGVFFAPETLLQLLKEGRVTQNDIDGKVRRILRLIVSNGFLDRAQLDPSIPENDPASAATALAVAQEGVVLLKNQEKLLPLDRRSVQSIAVLGPDAQPGVPAGGGSSFVYPIHSISLVDGLREVFGPGVKIDYFDAGVGSFKTAEFFHRTETEDLQPGLKGEYFDNASLSGHPVLSRIDSHIDFDWAKTGPALPQSRSHQISVHWTGVIRPADSGPHVFRARSSDGIRVFLNGELIIDEWSDHPPHTTTAVRRLDANKTYELRIDYHNQYGAALAQFAWASLSVPEELKSYDVAVIAAGFDDGTEGEGADRSFTLPDMQDLLIRNVAAKNPRTITILFCGGNVDTSSWLDQVPVLLHAWYPGQEGGLALAQVLSGEINPSGKLPVTFEKSFGDNPAANHYPTQDGGKSVHYGEGIFVGYRGYDHSGIAPRFPFGFGLSYTEFEYSELTVDSPTTMIGNPIQVKCRIKNTGDRRGGEIAQLYVRPLEPKTERPVRELKGFAKVLMEPGDEREVGFLLDQKAFQYFDPATHRFRVDAGKYEIEVGRSSRDLRLVKTVELISNVTD